MKKRADKLIRGARSGPGPKAVSARAEPLIGRRCQMWLWHQGPAQRGAGAPSERLLFQEPERRSDL